MWDKIFLMEGNGINCNCFERPDGENLGGHDPGEAAEAEVESRGEDHQQRERQPGDGAQPARGGATLCCVVIVLG